MTGVHAREATWMVKATVEADIQNRCLISDQPAPGQVQPFGQHVLERRHTEMLTPADVKGGDVDVAIIGNAVVGT